MCGGLRNMQSRSPPRLLDDLKPHTAAAADGQLLVTSCRHINPASPAPHGLAIVAALEAELVQSGSATSRNTAPSSSPSLPIPISSSWARAAEKNEGLAHHKRYDQRLVDPNKKGTQRSTIFSTSLSPPCFYDEESCTFYDFLGVCFCCKHPLGPGKDIYMYRGDQAFCSTECRYKHIFVDDKLQCSIQPNQHCMRTPSPSNKPKFTPPNVRPILV